MPIALLCAPGSCSFDLGRRGEHSWRVTVALSSAKFGLAVLSFCLNFGDLVSKRSWAEVMSSFGETLNKSLQSIPGCID